MKKVPMRTCIATRECLPKKELLRIVRTPQMTIEVDESGRLNGRGAYLKKSKEALEIAKKRKSLSKALDCEIDASVYEAIEKLLNDA